MESLTDVLELRKIRKHPAAKTNKKGAGRLRKAESDKAKPITIKLHQEHIEKMPRQNADEQFDGAANHLVARGTDELLDCDNEESIGPAKRLTKSGNPKRAGRLRKDSKDKAQPITIKLHKEHIEKLDWLKGQGRAEKVRNLLDSHVDMITRERRQIERLSKSIDESYRALRIMSKPEITESPDKFRKAKEVFSRAKDNLNALLDLYYFSPKDLVDKTDKDALLKLDAIFLRN